jgi:alpha-tubulin suppressor-like RCC1 family protein
MQFKLTSLSFVAQSFIVVAACVGAPSVAMADGTVLAWGRTAEGQCTIPTAAQSGVTAIAGGYTHTIALKGGAVLAWGSNSDGQCTIPASANSGVSAIAGGDEHTIALNRDIPSYQAEIAALTAQNATLTASNTALTARLNCGDLDGNGEVNGGDLGKLLISWGQCQ